VLYEQLKIASDELEGKVHAATDELARQNELLRRQALELGYRVAEAQNGVEAIDQAISLKPDVILMDLSMPIVDQQANWRQDDHERGVSGLAGTGECIRCRGEVDRLGARKLTFKYTGPWPPYNFVNIRLKLERV
jgi:hypothetical protein